LMATLVLLAYLLHTTLDWVDSYYRAVRGLLPSRRTFFEHLRALIQYLPFDDWDHLMQFMLKGLNGTIPDSG
ncbi:MAG: ISNCY family transposase, partial [Methylomicrobium sp.]|nr:ISNCY family transposase [Methylomicrobium sp.]